MKIKVGDSVLIIAGKDKGRTGEVLRLDRGKNKIVVAGINMAKKTVRRSQNGYNSHLDDESAVYNER